MTYNFYTRLFFSLSLPLLLMACQGGTASEPPMPTIVSEATATETAAPMPTIVSEATATETAAPMPEETTAPAPEETVTETTAPATEVASVETAAPMPETAPTETDVPPTATETMPPPATATPRPTPMPLNSLTLDFSPIASGFTKPLYLNTSGDDSGRLFVVEQEGRIWIVQNGEKLATPFLDIVNIVGSSANEQGLLSIAFHPQYNENGLFYLDYTNLSGDTVIAQYQVSADPNVAQPDSEQILLTIGQPYGNHNGGQLAFGPDDGYLYVGMGDGGAAGDPHDNGQSLDTLLGKILRLDVDNGEPYGVPQSNPFVDTADARPEIWSYGWRNPWRFAFDPATAAMYIADVGQNQYEELHFEPADAPGGLNYGWRLMEGNHCYKPTDCNPESLDVVLPVAEYDHSQGCSVTGGYVYRGQQYPALQNVYLYGDYCTGLIWGLRQEADGSWSQAQLAQTDYVISSFGQDEAGELYLIDHSGGGVYQVILP